MKNILDKIFKLPPVEERVDIRHSFLKKISLPVMAVKEKDEMYLCYLSVLASFSLGVIIGSLYLVAFFLKQDLDLRVAIIQFPSRNSFFSLFESFTKDLFYATLLVLLFFIVKFRWNIDPKKSDISRMFRADQLQKGRLRIIFNMILAITIMIFVMRFGYLFPQSPYVRFYFSQDSVITFAIFEALFIWIYSTFLGGVLMALMMLWRYIGPYEGKQL